VTVNLQVTNKYYYDLNGNMLTNGTRVLDYDDENELIRITEPNTWKSEFTYDGKMRRRIRKEFAWNGSSWLQTNEVHYVYDDGLVIQERSGNNLPQVTYTRGRDLKGKLESAGGIGGLIARTDMRMWSLGLGDSHSLYHADGNGNVVVLVSTNLSIVASYEYDPCGNILRKSGAMADANDYRFSSKEYHSASGLIYYLYRYYDTDSQRWETKDPIQEYSDYNLYSFEYNDSINQLDPFGLQIVIPVPWRRPIAPYPYNPVNPWQPPHHHPASPSQTGTASIPIPCPYMKDPRTQTCVYACGDRLMTLEISIFDICPFAAPLLNPNPDRPAVDCIFVGTGGALWN